MQVAGDLSRSRTRGRFVHEADSAQGELVDALARQIARAGGIVIAGDPDQFAAQRQVGDFPPVTFGEARLGLAVVQSVAQKNDEAGA